MNSQALFIRIMAALVVGQGWLSSCTLVTTDVEPELPTTSVNHSSTVAYHFNGQAVVAHNYTDLATLVIGPILSQFGGGGAPVQAVLRPDGNFTLVCVDEQSIVRPGYVQHGLTWQLAAFSGAGTYQPVPNTALCRIRTRDAADETWLQSPLQPLSAQTPSEITVTEWNPTTRHLRGTFKLLFDAIGNAPTADVRDGMFDLILAP